MSSRFDVAIIVGDGIGPELCAATKQVIEATGVVIDWIETPIGIKAKDKYGTQMPRESLETLKNVGVALKAPLIAEKLSGGVTIEDQDGKRHYPSINNAVRRELKAFANLRPVIGFEGVSGKYSSMDIVIVREVSEGIYIGIEEELPGGIGRTIKQISVEGSRRIGTYGYEYAVTHGRKRVTTVHKANVLHKTDGLFLKTIRGFQSQYDQIISDDVMIDAACYHIIKDPKAFDVLIMPNQYGDIFSDVAAGLIGSMGLAPGANIGEKASFFEASHGAAPDIAGQGIVNPVSLILSGAMLLDHLGQLSAGQKIRSAVEKTLLDQQFHTPDLGGHATTVMLTDQICRNI